MEEPLLPKLSSKKEEVIAAWSKSSGFLQDLKKVSMMAGPMVVVTVSQFLLQVVSLIMVGHLDQLSLAGVALATSFADVTGFSILVTKIPFLPLPPLIFFYLKKKCNLSLISKVSFYTCHMLLDFGGCDSK